jgi:HD-GYP domain-containing protein (c-di-GMP phosphodiesterase class II)
MKNLSSSEALSRFTGALSVAINAGNRYARFHCDRVSLLACEIGAACGLSFDDLTMLHISATLHDIGQIAISHRILCKPERLDEDEWVEMTTHPARSQHMVCSTGLTNVAQIGTIIRHHHEYFNGAGYPDGLAGETIPLLSRILSIADSYDAMATPCAYRRPRTHDEIMDVMRGEENIKFDPSVFRMFTYIIEQDACELRCGYEAGALV